MQSYPLHTHNVVLFLVSSWKQTFGVRRVVSVADRAWENIDLTFSSLWVRHSILITSTFGNCYDDSLHLGIINAQSRNAKKWIYFMLSNNKFLGKCWYGGHPWIRLAMESESMVEKGINFIFCLGTAYDISSMESVGNSKSFSLVGRIHLP